jgi:fluoroquinolone resistance protein
MKFFILLILFILFPFNRYCFGAEEFVGKTFKNLNFENQTLKNINYIDCEFINVSFKKSNLHNLHFFNTKLQNLDFSYANLEKVSFKKSNLGGSNFKGAKLENVQIHNSQAPKLSFWNSFLNNLSIDNSNLYSMDFSPLEANQINIQNSDMTDSYLWPKKINLSSFSNVQTNLSRISPEFLKNYDLKKSKQSTLKNQSLSYVSITKFPQISASCLKQFPIGNKPKVPQNGIVVVTDSVSVGPCFRPCLSNIDLELKLDLESWPSKLRNKLLLKIKTDTDSINVKLNHPFFTKDEFHFIKLTPQIKTMSLILESKHNFGVCEIEIVSENSI